MYTNRKKRINIINKTQHECKNQSFIAEQIPTNKLNHKQVDTRSISSDKAPHKSQTKLFHHGYMMQNHPNETDNEEVNISLLQSPKDANPETLKYLQKVNILK
eukprot:113393_1